jgi:hypothetical protein
VLLADARGSVAPEGSESAMSVCNWDKAVSDHPGQRHGVPTACLDDMHFTSFHHVKVMLDTPSTKP